MLKQINRSLVEVLVFSFKLFNSQLFKFKLSEPGKKLYIYIYMNIYIYEHILHI